MKSIQIGSAALELDPYGNLCALHTNGKELLSEIPQPFFRLHTDEGLCSPNGLSCTGEKLRFTFPGKQELVVSFTEKQGYAAFRVDSLSGGACRNLLLGPIGVRLHECVGEVVGVVQGEGLALGVQALNLFTLPGYPQECARLPHSYEEASAPAVSVGQISYFESAAFPAGGGSLLQLFAEDRRRTRLRSIMGADGVTIPAMEPLPDYDGAVTGMAFALFCCPGGEALDQIGRIELGEDLPHPMLGGEWAKTSRKAMASYLIAEFGMENIDRMLYYTKQAGLETLYHPEPFQSWGHFILRPEQFPDGDRSMAECCRQAAAQGVRLGLHTLTSFTTPNDEYVSPVPEKRLASYGAQRLTEAVQPEADALPVGDTALYQIMTTLQTVRIDQELISYQRAEDGALRGCTRGAFGTAPAFHAQGADVALLCDYPYKVFFPDIHLQERYTKRLVALFRGTGLAQISFDGLEGCTYTGEDLYALNRFCSQCWQGWDQTDLINDASRLQHNLWHLHTRMNWGEPWGTAMREGQTAYRIKNQEFFRRNLFPRMLGWFLIRTANRKFEATTPLDLEWALSMAAGFDAGFALSVSEEVLDTLGCTDELLRAVRNWETLRMAGAFPDELRAKLRDPQTEWHLERKGDEYQLFPMAVSQSFVCDLLEMQPGQPGGSDWVYDNPFGEQEYAFRLHVNGNGEILNPALSTPLGRMKLPCRIKGGQYLLYQNGKACRTNRNYRVIEEIVPAGRAAVIPGQQALSFSCDFEGEEGPEVSVQIISHGMPIPLSLVD